MSKNEISRIYYDRSDMSQMVIHKGSGCIFFGKWVKPPIWQYTQYFKLSPISFLSFSWWFNRFSISFGLAYVIEGVILHNFSNILNSYACLWSLQQPFMKFDNCRRLSSQRRKRNTCGSWSKTLLSKYFSQLLSHFRGTALPVILYFLIYDFEISVIYICTHTENMSESVSDSFLQIWSGGSKSIRVSINLYSHFFPDHPI